MHNGLNISHNQSLSGGALSTVMCNMTDWATNHKLTKSHCVETEGGEEGEGGGYFDLEKGRGAEQFSVQIIQVEWLQGREAASHTLKETETDTSK